MVVSFHGLRALTWNQLLIEEIRRYLGALSSRFMPFGLLWDYLDRARRETALVFSVQRFVSAGVAPPEFRTLSMAAYAIIGVQQLQEGANSHGEIGVCPK